MVENYRAPEDFLSDESFLSWFFKSDPVLEKQWEQWIAANPRCRESVQQAVELLSTIRRHDLQVTEKQKIAAENALMNKIGELQEIAPESIGPSSNSGKNTPIFFLNWNRRIVAACILLLITAGLFISRSLLPARPELRTAFGQIMEHRLPDGSDVIMNANSKVLYGSGWKDGVDREVWINGEAFFHVQKTPRKSRFIVHTDHFDIIVTGTQFNVVNRQGHTNVMLKEGSVTIHTPDGRDLYLQPGDFVEFRNDQPEKKPVKNDSLLAWREHKLVFDNTPVRELITIINDQYGVKVKLSDDSTGYKTISGILPNNNLDVLLQALEATTEFDVIRKDGDITIRRHTQSN